MNRVITGQLRSSTSFEASRALDEKSEVKLDRAYRKAHKVSSKNTEQASPRQLASTGLIVMFFAACGQLVARQHDEAAWAPVGSILRPEIGQGIASAVMVVLLHDPMLALAQASVVLAPFVAAITPSSC